MALAHHELCFGCGRVNLFGLLLELEAVDENAVQGRCFFKQDHQGPRPGQAHPGLVATALIEAITLLAGGERTLTDFELAFAGPPPDIGRYLSIRAEWQGDSVIRATASAGADQVARARGTLQAWPRA